MMSACECWPSLFKRLQLMYVGKFNAEAEIKFAVIFVSKHDQGVSGGP